MSSFKEKLQANGRNSFQYKMERIMNEIEECSKNGSTFYVVLVENYDVQIDECLKYLLVHCTGCIVRKQIQRSYNHMTGKTSDSVGILVDWS